MDEVGLLCAGYIVEGHLYCRPDEHGPLIPHSLDLDERCSVVKLPDHVHGPDCGHEIVAHGDHFDFLVRLFKRSD